MNTLNNFEILEDHAVFRPTGQFSVEQIEQMVTSAIAFARERRIGKLLVVTTGTTPIEPPQVATRYFSARDWAHASQGKVCVAVVARPEMIDFEKIGAIAAKNEGLRIDGFTSEEEALDWLQSLKEIAAGNHESFDSFQ